MYTSAAFHRILAVLAILAIVLLASCQNSTAPGGSGNEGLGGAMSRGSLSGKVTGPGNTGISGIQVSVGSIVGFTNTKGEFFLQDVPAGKRVLVNFSADAYASTQKIAEVVKARTTYIDASVSAVGLRQNLNAAAGGTFTVSGATVQFQPNALVDGKGAAFNGTAQVKATWFDPTGAQFLGCFPGEFSGLRSNATETGIESFGFMNVEISAGGEKLQLANGKPSTLTMPIPAALRGRAPQSIPLWYYDENKGQWIEEGSATRQGNNYVGTVAHFSSWNCDMPTQTSFLEGHVQDANGNPLTFATVHTSGVDYTGASTAHTDNAGYFKIGVKSASTASIWASYYIVSGASQTVTTPATGLVQDIGVLVIPVDTTQFCNIFGRVVDKGALPLMNARVSLLDAAGKQLDYLYTNKDGQFKFFGESGKTYTIEVNWYIDSTKQTKQVTCPVNPGNVDVGDIQLDVLGSIVTGRVVDANGLPLAQVSINAANGIPGTTRETSTDASGRFSMNVAPNLTFQLHLNYNQQTKTIDVTSGNLGETKDIGNITMP